MNRPSAENDLTYVDTEFKLLQIDIVSLQYFYLNSDITNLIKYKKDEKYQELITTAWVEMVS